MYVGSEVDRLKAIINDLDQRRLTALHERNEARSEIARHHDLIVEMRAALSGMCDEYEEVLAYVPPYFIEKWDYRSFLDDTRRFLNREVG